MQKRVIIPEVRTIQVDDTNPSKCGARCQFLRDYGRGLQYCHVDGAPVQLVDLDRQPNCVENEVP
jgi:hypothetical protein